MDGLRTEVMRRVRDPKLAARTVVKNGMQFVGRRVNYGITPFEHEHEWDVLVVLDACRYDLFEEFAPEHPVYERFDSVEPVYSCASATNEWLAKLLDRTPESLLSNTQFVTSNGKIQTEADAGTFEISPLHGVERVYQYAHRRDIRTTPPEAVTNAAIRFHRANPSVNLVAHYLQPHAPFAHCPERYEGYGHRTTSMWTGLRRGDWSEEQVWADYGLNLIYALDAVETLIENASGRVVVTSDHGNLFDPLRIGLYSHPEYLLFRSLKRVPWAVTTGGESDDYEVRPDEAFAATERVDVQEQLRDLGYVS